MPTHTHMSYINTIITNPIFPEILSITRGLRFLHGHQQLDLALDFDGRGLGEYDLDHQRPGEGDSPHAAGTGSAGGFCVGKTWGDGCLI